MTDEEYGFLFHEAKVNLVAFKPIYLCSDELRKMVEIAIEKERDACIEEVAKEIEKFTAFGQDTVQSFAVYIRGMKT